MKFVTAALTLLTYSFCTAQTLEGYLKIREQLNGRIKLLNDSLSKVDKKIEQLRLNEIKGGTGVLTTMNESARLLDDYHGNLVGFLESGDTVALLDWKSWYLLVECKGKRGYIPQTSVKADQSIKDVIKSLEESARKRHEAEIVKQANNYRAFKEDQKRDELKKKYPTWSQQTIDDIAQKKIWIGMTADMARESWGEPSKINRTVSGSYGVKEQWVYGDDYLYFKSGVLETYQVGR